MNLNQIINMVIRMVMRRGINMGINKGIDLAARRGKAPSAMTPEERKQAQKAKQTAAKARKAARITRRFF